MLEALKRRLRFLGHDLKHSFSPQSNINKSSNDTHEVFKDSESVELRQKLRDKTNSHVTNGTTDSLTNNELSATPNEIQGIDHEEDSLESESEIDDYSQIGAECTECGH